MNEASKSPTIGLWFQSYQRHLIHSVVYVGVLLYTIKSIQDLSEITPSIVGRYIVAGLAALALKAEITYVLRRRKLPPGDSGLPIFGHFLEVIQAPRESYTRLAAMYGSPYVCNLLMTPVLHFSNDDDVTWWLAQERKGYTEGHMIPHIKKLIGEEIILFQSGAAHKRLRRVFEPGFSPESVRNYLPLVDEASKLELEKWHNTGDFNSSREWALLAMRLFFVCAFGNVEEELLTTLNELFERWTDGFLSPIALNVPGTPLYKAHAAKKELAKVLKGMIDTFKKENPPDSEGAKRTMMGRLCYGVDEEGKTLPEEQLIANIHFILFAGHDTTKGSFCSFVHYLKRYPKLHEMLKEEVDGFSEPLNVDELKAAPLLNAFLAETWRLVSPLDCHNTMATKTLDYKGYVIPRGTIVVVDIQAYNIDEKSFPDAFDFRIERWLPPEHPLHNPKYYAKGIDYNRMSVQYRAFNTGPHMCLGSHFAKLEARVVLTRLIQGYAFELRNDALTKFPLRQYNSDFKLTKL